jgi:hypothetical protein
MMVFVTCSVLKNEIEVAILALGMDDEVIYISLSLHVDDERMKAKLDERLMEAGTHGEQISMIIGTGCNPEMTQIAETYSAKILPFINCLHLLLGDEMMALNQNENTYFLTGGWLENWRGIFNLGMGRDVYDAKMNFALYDRTLLLDSGTGIPSVEEQFDFFEYTGVPIEPYEITLEHFQKQLLCLKQE